MINMIKKWKVFACTLTLLSGLSNAYAQNYALDWVVKNDTTSISKAMAIDAGCNVYSATANALYKTDAAGNFVWTRFIEGINTPAVTVFNFNALCTDDSGDLYAAGIFKGTVDFDPGAGIAELTSNSTTSDGFIVKYNAAGEFIWARKFGSGRNCEVRALAADQWGNIHSTGVFMGAIDFNPGTDTFTLTTVPLTQADIFVSKLDAAGNFQWAKRFEGNANGADRADAITVDAEGNVFTTGHFRGTLDFDPGPGTSTRTVQGGVDAFLSKLDSAGNFSWVKHIGGTDGQEGYSLVHDSLFNVYITGTFQQTTNFDIAGANVSLSTVNSYDAFVAKYDSAGALAWVRQFGGNNQEQGRTITLDKNLNVYTAGEFRDTVDFDPGAGTFKLVPDKVLNSFQPDVYLSKLTNDGDFVWAKKISGNRSEFVSGIRVDNSMNIYTVGYFQSDSCDFDPGDNNTHYLYLEPLPPPLNLYFTDNQLFVHKMICADTSSSILTVSAACGGYSFNGTDYTESGVHTFVFQALSGCDSTVTLDLTIVNPEAIINVTGFVLGTTTPYASYQWFLNGNIIPNATGSTYTVSENGNYTVYVTDENGCSDTSALYTVNNVTAIRDINGIADKIKIYPVPATDLIHISSPLSVNVSLSGIEGKVIRSVKDAKQLSLSGLAEGIYLLRMTDKDGNLVKVEKIVKQ